MIEEKKFYWTLLDSLTDGVYFADRKRKITYWNNAAEAITGFKSNEILGKPCADNILIHIDEKGTNLCTGDCPLSRAMESGEPCEEKVYLHHKKGHRVPVLVRVTPVRGPREEIIGAVEIFSDLSPADRLSEVSAAGEPGLISQSTGLPTRRYLEMSLKLKLYQWNEFHHSFGIFYLEIGQLEGPGAITIKDGMPGVLEALSRTLANNLSPCDIAGEWEQGAFLGIVGYTDEKRLSASAGRYRMLLEQTLRSHAVAGNAANSITISVGTALARPGDTIESLLGKAGK
jgi:PAS domain S-box-containing protein